MPHSPLVSQIVGDHGPPGSPGCYTYGNTNLSWNKLLMVIETKEDPPIAAVVLALPLVLVLVLPIAMVAVMLVLAIVLVLAMVTVLLLVLVRKQEAESLGRCCYRLLLGGTPPLRPLIVGILVSIKLVMFGRIYPFTTS